MVGPTLNESQYEKLCRFFANCKKNGYKVVHGTDTMEEDKGYFIQQIIIDNPPNDSRIVQGEQFVYSGPIVPVQPGPTNPKSLRVSALPPTVSAPAKAATWSRLRALSASVYRSRTPSATQVQRCRIRVKSY
ncbi:hypothetical protein V1522DRAFT_446472 [Lipomyces starkeyi]